MLFEVKSNSKFIEKASGRFFIYECLQSVFT